MGQIAGRSDTVDYFSNTFSLIAGDSIVREDGVMNTTMGYSLEVRERAVRMIFDHKGDCDSECAAIGSISEKIGCKAETLNKWVAKPNGVRGVAQV